MLKVQEKEGSNGYDNVMYATSEVSWTNAISMILGISLPEEAMGSDTMSMQMAMVRPRSSLRAGAAMPHGHSDRA